MQKATKPAIFDCVELHFWVSEENSFFFKPKKDQIFS